MITIVLILLRAIIAGLFVGIFRYSCKQSLYLFRNVMFASGALFFGTQTIAMIAVYGIGALRGKAVFEGSNFESLRSFAKAFTSCSIPIFYVLMILIGISNISLMIHEGVRLKNIWGMTICYAFVIASAALGLVSSGLHAAEGLVLKFAIHELIFPYLFCLVCYFECVSLSISYMGWKAAKQIPAYDKDFIIILGCSISKKGGLLPLVKGRVNRAIRYAWEQEVACGRRVRFVPSGGQGPDEIMSEGSAMALYLQSHAAEEDEIFPEKKSRNTWENFCYSREIILRENPNARTAFATTNYHVFRSGLLARKAGFEEIEAISSKTKWYFWPNGFARELVGIFAMTWKVHALVAVVLLILCIMEAFL